MLKYLPELTSFLDQDEEGGINIASANWQDGNLILAVQVSVSGEPDRSFEITCQSPRSNRIIAANYDDCIYLSDDHVVLWPHAQKQGELYFKGTVEDAFALLGALLEAHRDTLGNWFPLDHFLNLPGRSTDIIRGGHGQLAKGPVPLLDRYASVLDAYGIKHSSPPYRDPKWWNGDKWVSETEQLYALVIGDSFVVAPAFREEAV